MPTRVRSFAKINLGLAVGPSRPDGFHALTTLYQTIALHDFVTITARPAAETRITLTANHPGVPRTETGDAEKNTAYAMVAGALHRLGSTAHVTIEIDKRLPVQGGLGAGSANAVAALLGLERELNLALPAVERLALAAEVGSDVPLFLLGGTVLGLGRGEQVYPLPNLPATPCVVAVPDVGVSTKLAFAELDKRDQGSGNREQGAGGRDQGAGNSVLMEGVEGVGWSVATSGTAGPSAALRFAQDDKSWGAAALKGETARLSPLPHPMSSISSPAPCSLLPVPCSLFPVPSPLTFPQSADRLEQLSRVLASVWSPDGRRTGPSGITRPAQHVGTQGDLAENPLLTLVRTGIENDFEEVAFSQHPSLRSTKRDLQGSGPGSAIFACLSGSGSALFGLYQNEADAHAAQQRVQAGGTRALLTETLTREACWDTMFAE